MHQPRSLDDVTAPAVRDVDNLPVAWREAGPPGGETVVFLHGLGASRTAWDPQLGFLAARGWRCAAWDMPGYGSSPPARAPLTFELLAAVAAQWLDALECPTAHVVGLSLGGMIAQHLALLHPRRVRSLALLDTSPAFGFDGVTVAREWIDARLRPLVGHESLASIAPRVLSSMMSPHASSDAFDQAVAAMSRVSSASFAAAVRCLVGHDVRDTIDRVRAPTIVMVGQLDNETPLPYAEFLATTIPGAQLAVVAGAGHISNLEQPAIVNDLLADFLARLV